MNMRRYWVSLAMALAAGGWAKNPFSMAEAAPDARLATVQATPREPTVGVGYHPGNFIGPLAFDVIIRPLPHVAVDFQTGYWSVENDVHGLGVAPQLQWEFLRGWQTPYVGLGFRYAEVWSDVVRAASKGGFGIGGWQFRWQSGFGVLLGVGVLYMTSVHLNAPHASYYSSGGLSGTYEVGVRYFF